MTEASAPLSSEDFDVSETPPVSQTCEGVFQGQKMRYNATAGRLPVKGEGGSIAAQIFYAAYTAEPAGAAARPLVFFTNGGPGAATAWLHVGGLGPRRIVMNDDGSTPPPPARLADNPDCVLHLADLVFIDAAGTGYSRVASDPAKERLFARDGDLDSYVQFILRYLRDTARWASPIYLFGESYGSMRVAALSDLLVRRGVPVSGVVLMSSAIDCQLIAPGLANPLPYVLALPSFATIAAYHGRIDDADDDLGKTLRQHVQDWAEQVYHPALLKGARLGVAERDQVAAGLVRYTGLPEAVIRAENLRIDTPVFMKYLRADEGLIVGRTDGRIVGPPVYDQVEEPYYDPAMGAMTPAFASAANQLLRGELKLDLDLPYRMYSRDVATRFLLGPAPVFGRHGAPQSLTALQSAFVKQPSFRILSLQSLFDIASPYRTTEFALEQLAVLEDDQLRITQVRLAGGHMGYVDTKVRQHVGQAFAEFLRAGVKAA